MESNPASQAAFSGKRIALTNVDSWMGACTAMHLAKELENKCKDVQIVCMARRTENLDRLKRYKNVHLVKVDYDDEKSLERAFQGVKCTILIPENDERRVEYARNVMQSMKKQNVRSCMMISCEGADQSDLRELKSFREIEKEVERSCSDGYVILRKSFINQVLLLWSPIVQEKAEFPMTVEKDREMAPLDANDLVRAIETIVVEHCRQSNDPNKGWGNHKNKTYTLTGPHKINPEQLVHEMGEAAGRKIQYRHVSRDELKKYFESLKKREILSSSDALAEADRRDGDFPRFSPNESMIQLVLDELELVKKGQAGFVSRDLEKIIGHNGQSIKDFLRKERDAFRPHRED